MLVSFNNTPSQANFKGYEEFYNLEGRPLNEVQLILRGAYQNTKKILIQRNIIEKADKFRVPLINLELPLTEVEKTRLKALEAQPRKKPERYGLDFRNY